MRKEIILSYKGYVIRSLRKPCVIALPEDISAVYSPLDQGISEDVTIEEVKTLIDKLKRKRKNV